MQTVSRIYRSESIGNRVRIAVVKMVILKENESFAPKGYNDVISASEMLKTFCRWQHHIKSNDVTNFDVALLLTRYL